MARCSQWGRRLPQPSPGPGRKARVTISLGTCPARPLAGGATAAACEVREGSVPASCTSAAVGTRQGKRGGGARVTGGVSHAGNRGAQTKRLGADGETGAPAVPTVRARGPFPVRRPHTVAGFVYRGRPSRSPPSSAAKFRRLGAPHLRTARHRSCVPGSRAPRGVLALGAEVCKPLAFSPCLATAAMASLSRDAWPAVS